MTKRGRQSAIMGDGLALGLATSEGTLPALLGGSKRPPASLGDVRAGHQ